jgi:hypothetical protein
MKPAMTKTFKQQVGEIVYGGCPYYEIQGKCSKCDKVVDRILTAHNAELDRIAEGMPFKCANCGIEDAGICDRHECVDSQLIECQAYIQAQKG